MGADGDQERASHDHGGQSAQGDPSATQAVAQPTADYARQRPQQRPDEGDLSGV